VAPLDRANVDTDAIIPKQFLKSIKRSGFGPNAFDEWRYWMSGEPGQDNSRRAPKNPEFRAQPAALSGRADPAGAQQLRLRLVARARAVGAARLRLSRHHRPSPLPTSSSTTASRTACCRSCCRPPEIDALFAPGHRARRAIA
jgi:hypothetical protein